jgi:predicted transcriptional regulator
MLLQIYNCSLIQRIYCCEISESEINFAIHHFQVMQEANSLFNGMKANTFDFTAHTNGRGCISEFIQNQRWK